jgi:hypothetical protein
MKKILIIIILFFGVVPCLKKGKISIIGVESTYADDYGGEAGDDNEDPCDPSSSAFSIQSCNNQDQCNTNSDYYDDTVCEMQTCNPSSVNYNIDECDAAVCDDNSYYTNADLCEDETCLPDNINYNIDECDAQVCDDTSDGANPDLCEDETCLPDNINWDPIACATQACDITSDNYSNVKCIRWLQSLQKNRKPKAENSNKCAGIQAMWDSVTGMPDNPEGIGYITADGKFIYTTTTGSLGGSTNTIAKIDGIYYYEYNAVFGAPTQTYEGMIMDGPNYAIPIVAIVHTHNECLNDWTNGLTQSISDGDKATAHKYPGLHNYVVGCDADGSYADGDTNYTVFSGSSVAANCNKFQ